MQAEQGGLEALARKGVMRQPGSWLEVMTMAWMGQNISDDEEPNQHSQSKPQRKLLAQHDERVGAHHLASRPLLPNARRLTGVDAGSSAPSGDSFSGSSASAAQGRTSQAPPSTAPAHSTSNAAAHGTPTQPSESKADGQGRSATAGQGIATQPPQGQATAQGTPSSAAQGKAAR